MLSIANLTSSTAAAAYYEHDNYYTKSTDQSQGQWYGTKEGKVDSIEFEQSLKGDVKHIHKKNGNQAHAPGIDLTFSAPKSISIMALIYKDQKLLDAHDIAVKETLAYVEKNLVSTRVQQNGKASLEAVDNITAALFRHDLSRALDPQLHTHAVILNKVTSSDGKQVSAYFGQIFENKKFLGKMYVFILQLIYKKLDMILDSMANKMALN